ncbi:MAG: EamA family transporter, partial [Candidatus Eremiobacteraeota bacterium]|nr:EamA family transporter [Candidatus Eremiobacteraeota bacterium]
VLYLAILGSGVAFFLNHWLLRRLSAWAVGLSALVIPVLAVIVGALLGGEAFGVRDLLGAALVLVGIVLALRAPQPLAAPSPDAIEEPVIS